LPGVDLHRAIQVPRKRQPDMGAVGLGAAAQKRLQAERDGFARLQQ